jgi:hypothetical protein
VALVAAGSTPEQAAKKLQEQGKQISAKTITRGVNRIDVRPAQPAPPEAPTAPVIVAGAPIERLRAYAAHDLEALAVLERMASTPAIVATDLKAAALRHLAQLETDYHTAGPIRRGPLAKAILAAIRELRVYFPPAPPQKSRDELIEELRRLDEETLALIEQHAPNPIEAKEIQ